MATQHLIRISRIEKAYASGTIGVAALRGITVDIRHGEYIAVMGPSGSGKSTLINLLGCLDRPSGGDFWLDGIDVTRLSAQNMAQIRNDKIGFVFQNFNLLARTTAVENVEVPLLYSRRLSSRQRRQQAVEVLERVGLADRLDHHPSQLSGGQQQRVAIARALVNRPSVLMADEPTGNLDTRTSKDVMRMFRELNEQGGLTVILVTHDQDVARISKRIIVLRDGEIVEDTTHFAQAMRALHSGELEEAALEE